MPSPPRSPHRSPPRSPPRKFSTGLTRGKNTFHQRTNTRSFEERLKAAQNRAAAAAGQRGGARARRAAAAATRKAMKPLPKNVQFIGIVTRQFVFGKPKRGTRRRRA